MSRKENVQTVKENICRAAQRAGRSPQDIQIVAVSKTFELPAIREVYEAGIRDFGENRAQELRRKSEEFDGACAWHFIGRLQTNKVRDVLGRAVLIHSLDREELAQELQRRCERSALVCDALVQVNVSAEQTKAGVDPRDLPVFLKTLQRYSCIRIKGLMTIAPFTQEPEQAREVFSRLRRLRDSLRGAYNDLTELSMGMSSDYCVAVEEGATIVRIGSAVFGTRDAGE